jgi:hypothetical protein
MSLNSKTGCPHRLPALLLFAFASRAIRSSFDMCPVRLITLFGGYAGRRVILTSKGVLGCGGTHDQAI